MQAKIVIINLCVLLCSSSLFGISLVYNLRIAETTRTRNTAFGKLDPSVVALTPFAQFRSFETDFHQSAGGVLGNYIYATDDWYARVNAAVGHCHADGPMVGEFGATELDDLLLTGGYSWQFGEQTRISLSGHFGIPLHRDYVGDLVELGTGHVGLGFQVDGLHAFNDEQALLLAVRAIYFFPRDVTLTLDGKTVHLSKFRLGDLIDFFISYQHIFDEQRHLITAGYDLTYTCGTDDPTDPFHIRTLKTLQNSLFATYRYAFSIKEYLSAIIIGFSYGFLNVPAPLDHGYSATVWLTWGINF